MTRILIFTLVGMFVHSSAEPGPFSTPGLPSGPRIKLNTMADSDPVFPGDRFKLYLSVQIEEDWHIYSLQPLDGNELLATQIILDDNVFESAGDWQESSPSLIQDDAQAKLVKAHTNIAEFHKNFHIPENFNPGSYRINGKLHYRACDNKLCTLPQNLPFVSRIHVGVTK